MNKFGIVTALCLALTAGTSKAQVAVSSGGGSHGAGVTVTGGGSSSGVIIVESGEALFANRVHFEATEMEDDPGYDLYKAGYSNVLDGEWNEARSQFRELVVQYPESNYLDDAYYWTAYSFVQANEYEEGIDQYHEFLESFPASPYYDDAVADLTEAKTRLEMLQLHFEFEELAEGESKRALQYYTRSRDLERELQAMAWSHAAMSVGYSGKDLEPETQLRIDALNALSNAREDDQAFSTLKEVALDLDNPAVLRGHAIQCLSTLEYEQTLPVFVEIAKKDMDEDLRLVSIDCITRVPDANSVNALIEIFDTIPPKQDAMSARVFYAIAEVGNDEAIDFLTSVAQSNEDLTLRREAVYYLGAIGNDRARSSLHIILKGKPK